MNGEKGNMPIAIRPAGGRLKRRENIPFNAPDFNNQEIGSSGNRKNSRFCFRKMQNLLFGQRRIKITREIA